MKRIVIQANAKINLALAVKHKRADGYHEIESIFQEIDFGDVVELAPAEGIYFESDLRQLNHEGDTNTCIRAARLIQEELTIPGVSIKLTKRIPLGGGLGGGSSDAAAVLQGLVRLYDKNVSERRLWQLAQEIGSDVPFFLRGKTAHVSGRGEIINPVTVSEGYFIVLVMPGIHISTPQAYKNLKRGLTKNDMKFKFISSDIFAPDTNIWKSMFYNDFEDVVFERYPELAEIKAAFYRQGAGYAVMSGSGSSLFGVFKQEAQAKEALRNFSAQYRCLLTQPVLDL
jgi:4-diphosphocytidyl-2-C-methyl-D-erythritol kinase